MECCQLVLVANEPATYRSLLAAELPFLRPHLRVLEIAPGELDSAVECLRPAVVVCSHEGKLHPDPDVSVLVLRTEEIDAYLHSLEDVIVNPRLSDILGAIDRAMPNVCTAPACAHHAA